MWIMITREIPVLKEFQPKPMDIYWALPWNDTRPKIREVLALLDKRELNSILKMFIPKMDDRPYLSRFRNTTRWKNDQIFDNIELSNQILDYISTFHFFPDKNEIGFTPNNLGKMRIIVNNENVGIFPHEFSKIKKEDMKEYLEKSHKLVMTDYIKEVFDTFDEDQKFIRDAAMLDGCDYDQASRVAIGKDPAFDFPTPLGYYSCHEKYRSLFFTLKYS